MLRMHRTIGTAKRRSRIPRSRHPAAVELAYGTALVNLVKMARAAAAPAVAELANVLASAKVARGDAYTTPEQTLAPLEVERFAGFWIVIENPVGSVRNWRQPDGSTGTTVMLHPYGYIDGAIGADGEEVDVYLGPDESAPWVYIVHQQKAPAFDTYDEDKVMLGFASADDAKNAYLGQYSDPRFFGGMTMMSVDNFRTAIAHATEGRKITHADRVDAGEGARARQLVDRARQQFQTAVHPNAIDTLAGKFGKRTSDVQLALFKRQARAALGIDISTLDKGLPTLIGHFAAENVSLIKSLGNKTFDDIEKLATRAVTSGTRHEEMAADMEERFGIAERHARLIARDQIGKLNGQVTRARHKEVGINKFTWRTAGDERVRPEHDDLDGQEFSYDDPPSEGLPGEPVCCRCGEDPVFDDLLGAADDDEDDDSDSEDN